MTRCAKRWRAARPGPRPRRVGRAELPKGSEDLIPGRVEYPRGQRIPCGVGKSGNDTLLGDRLWGQLFSKHPTLAEALAPLLTDHPSSTPDRPRCIRLPQSKPVELVKTKQLTKADDGYEIACTVG